LSRRDDLIVWSAEVPDSRDRYVAFFNAQNNDSPFNLSQATYRSRAIRGAPGKETVDISVPITNAHRLVLVLGDAGDNSFYDHGAWIEPTLTGPKGSLKLTDLKWVMATAGWGQARVNRTVDGQPLTLDGQTVNGIGTHAVSVIEYEPLPEGYDTFTARGVITSGNQGKGSVQFQVLVDPPKKVVPDRSPVSVSFADLGVTGPAGVRDLWSRENLGVFTNSFTREIPIQNAGLYRVSPKP
jgi:alpha-galactosidase